MLMQNSAARRARRRKLLTWAIIALIISAFFIRRRSSPSTSYHHSEATSSATEASQSATTIPTPSPRSWHATPSPTTPPNPADFVGQYALVRLEGNHEATAAPHALDSVYALQLFDDGTGEIDLNGDTFTLHWDINSLTLIEHNGEKVEHATPHSLHLNDNQLIVTGERGTLVFIKNNASQL